MTFAKDRYREQAKHLLKNMSSNDKDTIEKELRFQLFHTDEWEQAEIVGVTISQGLEWDTRAIIHHSWKSGKQVVVPKSQPSDKTITFYSLNSFDELEIAHYNLLEPKPDPKRSVSKQQIDLLIVPGLMFDKRGYRIGFGGGYYDRFLNDFEGSTLSLLSSQQLVDALPVETFDERVDVLVTEQACMRTGGT